MEFFGTGMIPVTLVDINLKRNAQGERRIHLKCEMELSPQVLRHAPEGVHAAFNTVSKVENGIVTTGIATEYANTRMEIFELPDSESAMHTVKVATLRGITVYRPTGEVANESTQKPVYCAFETTVPGDKSLWAWGFDFKGMQFYSSFGDAQGELDMSAPASKEPPKETKKDGKKAAAGKN